MRARLSCVWQVALGVVTAPLAVDVTVAQTPSVQSSVVEQPAPAAESKKSKKASRRDAVWRVSPSFRVDAEYDNNVFLLAPDKKNNVAAPSGAEVTSGRYADMKNARDVLTTMAAGVTLKGPGLTGKPFLIAPDVSYELYAQNTERSHVSLGLSIQQQAWADGRLRLQGRLTPSYFARNYLTDAVDQDTNGSIAEEERVYTHGEYRESQLGADYRLPIVKSRRKHPFGAAVQLGGGYYSRSYDTPLNGRDLQGPMGSAKLLLDFGRRVELDVSYDYSSLGASRSNQVLLLNEADFGQDFNANGTATDLDARVATMVDRSRNEHSLGATLRFKPSKLMELILGYEHRWRRYTSGEALDVANRGREDARHQLSGDLRFRVTKDLRLRVGGVHSSQNLNRSGDPGSAGEIDDYTRSQARLGLSYEL